MEKAEIIDALKRLNEKLSLREVKGEICVYGGAAMCLAFDARPSTKDVDAVFRPTDVIRQAVAEIAAELGLSEDWLNDGVKGFVTDHDQSPVMSFSNLAVYVPEAKYLFAMKAIAARLDSTDRDDVIHLAKVLGIERLDEALAVIERFYPQQQIRPTTQFFLEEVFGESDDT